MCPVVGGLGLGSQQPPDFREREVEAGRWGREAPKDPSICPRCQSERDMGGSQGGAPTAAPRPPRPPFPPCGGSAGAGEGAAGPGRSLVGDPAQPPRAPQDGARVSPLSPPEAA